VVSLFADRRTLRTMRLMHWNQQQRRKVYHTRVLHRAAVHELDIGARTRLRAGDVSAVAEANGTTVPVSLDLGSSPSIQPSEGTTLLPACKRHHSCFDRFFPATTLRSVTMIRRHPKTGACCGFRRTLNLGIRRRLAPLLDNDAGA